MPHCGISNIELVVPKLSHAFPWPLVVGVLCRGDRVTIPLGGTYQTSITQALVPSHQNPNYFSADHTDNTHYEGNVCKLVWAVEPIRSAVFMSQVEAKWQ